MHGENRPLSRDANRRWRLALAGSVVAHLLASGGIGRDAIRPVSHAPTAPALAVTIRPMPAVVPGASTPIRLSQPSQPSLPPAEVRDLSARQPLKDAPALQVPAEREPAHALALPDAHDPNVYAARDLDILPVPVSPLEIDRWAGMAEARPVDLRLDVVIDEHGAVKAISFSRTVPPGIGERELRDLLSATRFYPARKDGRPVKSRVTLSVRFNEERTDQRRDE